MEKTIDSGDEDKEVNNSILDSHDDNLTVEKAVTAVSAAAMIAGSFSPWIFAWDMTAYGIEGNGVFTLFLAIVGALIMNYYSWDWRAMIGGAIIGALIVSITLYNVRWGAAYGIYLTLLGGIGLLASSLYGFQKVDPRSE